MDNTTVYDNFLKSLKVAMTNTSVYFREHPLFLKSLEDLKLNIDKVFTLLNPLRIGITSDSLNFGNDCLKGKKIYEDTVEFFHRRKIKSIKIDKAVTAKNLGDFIGQVNASPDDILKKGGMENILKQEEIPNITVKDLGYGQFLEGDGQKCKDIWEHLLKVSIKQKDDAKIKELADNFNKLSEDMDVGDLLNNKETEENIKKMLSHLKVKDKDRFMKCGKDLAKAILRTKNLREEEKEDKVRGFFEELKGEHFSEILLEQIKSGGSIDSLNLDLFSRFINIEKHKDIACFLARKLEKEGKSEDNVRVASKVKELFSLLTNQSLAEIYRYNLSSILENISLGEGARFNQERMKERYCFVLLNLFVAETDSSKLNSILDNIFLQLDEAIENNNISYVKFFVEIIKEKREQFADSNMDFIELNSRITVFFENITFEKGGVAGFYLDKIFREGKVNREILMLFDKFFPGDTNAFYEYLDRRINNVAFIRKIIDSLKALSSPFSFEVFKRIFSLSNSFMKIEALRAMRKMSIYDAEFLFSILEKSDFFQRRQAFLILLNNAKARGKAARILLRVSNPLGMRTRVIMENLKIIGEAPFVEAKKYLYGLYKYNFFWNRGIRKKAEEIFKKING